MGVVIRVLGTPNDRIWPGVSELPDYSKITFKTLKDMSVPLEEVIPDAGPEATDLFKRFIIYDSNKRISAQKALTHPYLSCNPLPARLADMPLPGGVGSGKRKPSMIIGPDGGGASMMMPGPQQLFGNRPESAAQASPSSSSAEKEYRTDRSFAETFQTLMDMKY